MAVRRRGVITKKRYLCSKFIPVDKRTVSFLIHNSVDKGNSTEPTALLKKKKINAEGRTTLYTPTSVRLTKYVSIKVSIYPTICPPISVKKIGMLNKNNCRKIMLKLTTLCLKRLNFRSKAGK